MMHAAVAAIQFALEAEDGQSFLRLWNKGEFDVCRREWPEAPKEVYVGADPMLPETRAMLGAVSYQQGRMRFFIEQVMRGEQPDTRRAAALILDELYPNNGAKAAPAQELCEDEGCPHHGTPHVCVNERERDAAVATLKGLGYAYHGGEQWKPPLGNPQATRTATGGEGALKSWVFSPNPNGDWIIESPSGDKAGVWHDDDSALAEVARQLLQCLAQPETTQGQSTMRHSDTARLNLLTDCIEGNWSIRFRIKPGKAPQWQMIDDGDPWGKWHNCPRKAIDAALDAVKGLQHIVKDYEATREKRYA